MAVGLDVDLLLRGGTVVNHDGARRAEVAIKDGRVAALLAPGVEVAAAETVDVTGKHLFPGAIDPHTHVTNRRPFDESFARETPSMALGGTTTIIDFLSVEDSFHTLAGEAIQAIEGQAYVDAGLHTVLMSERHLRELPEYVDEYGVSSFKMYMAAGGQRLYQYTLGIDDGLFLQALRAAARMGDRVLPMVHAENWEIARMLRAELEAAGRTDPAAWTESRPNLCEVDCLRRAALLAQAAGARLYVVHLSTREAPGILRESRAQGMRLFGETCPQYLMAHKDHPRALVARHQPAIKASEDNDALWQALLDGVIECMGSDHIPVRWPDKLPGRESIWTARGGLPGSGTILPLLLSEGVARRGMALERVVQVASYNAARLFGLYPRKGAIAVGSDADIVVADLSRRVTVAPALLGLDFTLFDGLEFVGWPEMTVLRGRLIARDGQLVGGPGGRYLRRAGEAPNTSLAQDDELAG